MLPYLKPNSNPKNRVKPNGWTVNVATSGNPQETKKSGLYVRLKFSVFTTKGF